MMRSIRFLSQAMNSSTTKIHPKRGAVCKFQFHEIMNRDDDILIYELVYII